MTYVIHLVIPEDSPRGHVIGSIAAERHISPQEAVEAAIDLAANGVVQPAQPRGIRKRSRKPLRSDEPDAIFGLFAGTPGFRESIDAVIAGRAGRYGDGE